MFLNTLLLLIFLEIDVSLADLSLFSLERNIIIIIIEITVH